MTRTLNPPRAPPVGSPTHETSNRQLTGEARAQVRRMQAGVLLFYTVDGLLLTGYGWAGTIAWQVGWLYALAGCCGAAAMMQLFWQRGGRFDDFDRMNMSQTVLAAAVMLTTLACAPAVGGLMLMSLMAVLSLGAIQFSVGQLVVLCPALAAASMTILAVTGEAARIPGAGASELALTGVWFAYLMAKASAHNAVGRRLRQLVGDANAQLAAALREVEIVAATDELTSLPNRRSIVGQLKEALEQTIEAGCRVGVAVLDIDRFKSINDRYGHDVGDRVLCTFAEVAAASLRPCDRIGRYGGEEFLLVLRQLPDAGAAAAATERVRARVEAHDWDALASGLAVRVSAGVAIVWPDETSGAAIQRADAALYEAKRRGRNQVIVRAEVTRLE